MLYISNDQSLMSGNITELIEKFHSKMWTELALILKIALGE